MPTKGDKVYVYETPKGSSEHWGDVVSYSEKTEKYKIELNDGKTVYRSKDDFETNYEGRVPMWSTMWSFRDSADEYWLTEMDGIRIMSECGFRVYESREFGYFFGIDAGGFDFYDAFWCPLYLARGLHWHENKEVTA